MYERKIDLMSDAISPRNAYSHYAQKENPARGISRDVKATAQTNEAIIEFVANQMTGTLGGDNDAEPR